ncbi:MAG: hypothetical protein GX552_07870 [Chloroflexi bacterium]|jgi:hypothetical protein|nr:hypothetical protein [Chloroflexota bacterium]
MSETPWYRKRDVQEAIRNLIVAILLVLLALLGYDVGVAQPRLEQALARQEAATTLYQAPDASAPCLDVR